MYHPRLKGNHYEMGFHYGSLLKENGVSLEETIKLTDEQIKFGKESIIQCEKYIPKIMQEVRGLAEGLKLDYSIVASWLLSIYCFGDEHGCSCFAVKHNEEVFFARNSDMFPEYKLTSESILYRPENENIFLGHSTNMISMEDGLNEHGLAVGMTFLLPKEIKPGLNVGFIIRAILEQCKTTEEAISFLKSIPISSTQNIVIADKTGDLAVVECSCNKIKVIKDKTFVIATNQFNETEMLEENNNPEDNWYHSNERYQTIEKSLNTNSDIDINYIKELLSGKKGFICQYEKELNFDTLWSTVYNLNTLYNEIAEGNPSRTKFKHDNRLEWGISKKNKK